MTVGHVHGRFQPFHQEHLEYAAWGASESDELIIGITNADPSHIKAEDADPERHEPRRNPFRYHERHRMVREAVAAATIEVPVRIMPFPINRPELYDDYAPPDTVYFVNVLEEWHKVKVDRLREVNRTVRTKQGTRTISGESIRERMAFGGDWATDIPTSVAETIREVNGVQRVKNLYGIE